MTRIPSKTVLILPTPPRRREVPLIFRGRQEGLVEERGLLVKPGIQEEGAGGRLPSWGGRAPFPPEDHCGTSLHLCSLVS